MKKLFIVRHAKSSWDYPELNDFDRPLNRRGKNNAPEMGKRLARETPAAVDLVLPVPDSGVAAAKGYADQLGVPFEMGIVRNHYVGRTFIEPTQEIRDLKVKMKPFKLS